MPTDPEGEAHFWVERNVARWNEVLVLRDSLLSWYQAIDALEPGRVRFGLPEGGLPHELIALGPRRVRSGAALFDRFLTLLPA